MAYEADKRNTLYAQSREMLEALEHRNEILADIAGEDYVSPGPIPHGVYAVQKRMLEVVQYANTLLDTIAEASGPELPEVSADDDGDVLTVSGGKWTKAASGGTVLVVTDTSGTLDKTWKQIYDAAFCVIVTIDETGPEKIIQPVTAVYLEDGEYTVEAGVSVSYVADAEDGYPATTSSDVV